jgi:hypothetical protein
VVFGENVCHLESCGTVVRNEIGLELAVVRQLILRKQADDRFHAQRPDFADPDIDLGPRN